MRIKASDPNNYPKIKQLLVVELSALPSHGSDGKNRKDKLESIKSLLSICNIRQINSSTKPIPDSEFLLSSTQIIFEAPLWAYQQLENNAENILQEAFSIVFRRYIEEETDSEWTKYSLSVHITLSPNWTDEIEPRAINQNIYGGEFEYRDLSFNSPGEVAIAKELDRRGILYMANCPMMVGKPEKREPIFPDFLIFHEGRWGILEVSGRTYHPDTVEDSEKARKIRAHINIPVEHFDSVTCKNNPSVQVDEFLKILMTD